MAEPGRNEHHSLLLARTHAARDATNQKTTERPAGRTHALPVRGAAAPERRAGAGKQRHRVPDRIEIGRLDVAHAPPNGRDQPEPGPEPPPTARRNASSLSSEARASFFTCVPRRVGRASTKGAKRNGRERARSASTGARRSTTPLGRDSLGWLR
jgi:hypothetical protein